VLRQSDGRQCYLVEKQSLQQGVPAAGTHVLPTFLEHHFESKGVAGCPSAQVFDMQLDDWIQYWSARPDCFVGSKSDPGVLRLLQRDRDRENCVSFESRGDRTTPVQTCSNEPAG
jgi:hypothetical protein